MAVSSALYTAPANAQPAPTDAAKRSARELADKGYEYYEAGEFAKAIPYFRDAEARFHAPTLLLVQANCQVKVGGFVEARALYQKIVDEKLAPDAPKEFQDAQVEAAKGLDNVAPHIATLKIAFKGMTPDKVRLSIDDVEIPNADILKPLPQNPGTHKIVATIGGDDTGRAVFQSVTLKEGTTKQIQLVFRAGGPVNQTAPGSGGCASCEIGTARGPVGASAGLLSTLALTALTALRRRRQQRRHAQ